MICGVFARRGQVKEVAKAALTFSKVVIQLQAFESLRTFALGALCGCAFTCYRRIDQVVDVTEIRI